MSILSWKGLWELAQELFLFRDVESFWRVWKVGWDQGRCAGGKKIRGMPSDCTWADGATWGVRSLEKCRTQRVRKRCTMESKPGFESQLCSPSYVRAACLPEAKSLFFLLW